LLIPDLEALNIAIEDHIAKHMKTEANPTNETEEKIRNHLITQIFRKINTIQKTTANKTF
jgi:hypothetical protein